VGEIVGGRGSVAGGSDGTGGGSGGGSVVPPVELCGNGVDDDGDGATDEDCGCAEGETRSCYAGAPAHMGVGACRLGVQRCMLAVEFYLWGECEGAVEPVAETCNGVDDDCDGLVDGNDPSMVVPSNFCVQIGPCAGSSPVCQGSRGWVCNYGPDIDVNANGTVSVIERRCDGKDNNCNTQIDETFPLKGQPCTNGEGRCARSTTYTCRPDETAVECLAVPVPTDAIDEDCNAIDDNCDGQIDESDPLAGAQCYNGGQHQCLGWIDPMVQVGSKWVYTYEASRPAASNTDPGVEDTRACSKANVLPWTSLNQAEAEAACSAVVDGAGQPMRLCTLPI
jgi:hypothetical protein